MQKLFLIMIVAVCFGLAGCAGAAKHAPIAMDDYRKQFARPAEDKAAVYIYRSGIIGKLADTQILINGKFLGKNSGSTYLYVEVPPGECVITSTQVREYTTLPLNVEGGKIYFIRDSISPGLFLANLLLTQVDEETGKKEIQSCKLIESAM